MEVQWILKTQKTSTLYVASCLNGMAKENCNAKIKIRIVAVYCAQSLCEQQIASTEIKVNTH